MTEFRWGLCQMLSRTLHVDETDAALFIVQWTASGAPPTFVNLLLAGLRVVAQLQFTFHCPWYGKLRNSSCQHSWAAGSKGTITQHDGPDMDRAWCFINHNDSKRRIGSQLSKAVPDMIRVATWNCLTLVADSISVLGDSGSLRTLTKKLADLELDWVVLQETRSRLEGEMTSGQYTALSSPSSGGEGGLITLIRKNAGFNIVAFDILCDRLTLTHLRVGDTLFYIFNIHGPTELAPEHEYERVWNCLADALDKVPSQARRMVMGDYNLRLGGGDLGDTIAPYATTRHRWRSQHMSELFSKHHLFVFSTFHEGSAGDTWRHARFHASGKGAQLDHMAACGPTSRSCSRTCMISAAELATVTLSDHEMLCAELHWQRREKTGNTTSIRFANSEHQTSFLQAWRSQPQQSQDGEVEQGEHGQHPFQHFRQWICGVRAILDSTRPAKVRSPKKEWISDGTWEFMTQASERAKVLAAWHRRLGRYSLVCSFWSWRATSCRQYQHSGVAADLATGWNMTVAHLTLLRWKHRLLRILVKQRCRKDKSEWLKARCIEIKESYEAKTSHFHRIAKQLGKWKPRSAPRYDIKGAQYAHSTAELQDRWRQHWVDKLGASEAYLDPEFMKFDCYRPVGSRRVEPAEIEMVTQAEVVSALRRFNYSKASADVVHAEVLKPVQDELAVQLVHLYNHILKTAQVPVCWRGAEVRAVPKPKDAGAYRPISLLVISQRIFTRVLLHRLKQVLCLDSSQMAMSKMGGCEQAQAIAMSKMGGCEQAHAIVSAVDLWARREKLAMAHLHIDLRAACDSILRQVLVGVHDDADQSDVEGNTDDLSFAQLKNLALFFETHCVPLLQHRGIPPYLLDVLRNMQGGLWAQIPGLPGHSTQSFVSVASGVRQGCSLSPWLFSLYVGVIMSDLDDIFKERGLDFTIPKHGRFAGQSGDGMKSINAILFADDITFMRADADGRQLLHKCRQVMQLCKATFERYCLKVNQGAGKTELCVHFPKQASALKAGLAQSSGRRDGKHTTLVLEDGSHLIVSTSYLFLGRWSNPSGAQAKEVKVRRGAGLSAVKEISNILKSVEVPTVLKVNQCSSLAISRLSYCIGVCDLYTARDLQVLSRG
eukprot:5964686-Amphidinium_carterae.3